MPIVCLPLYLTRLLSAKICLIKTSQTWLRLFSGLFLVFGLALVTGCSSLPNAVNRPVSTALNNPASTPLGQTVARRAATAGTRNDSGFALVHTADLAFTSRMTLINAAQKTLDIQYYAIFADSTTERLFAALRAAAARGVRIRILLDDFNASGKNAQVLKLAFEKNIELRLFNPIPGNRSALALRLLTNVHDVNRIQRRMHNKILVADNAIAITGGRNLGETYFGQSSGTNFVDVDVLAAGRIVRDLSRSFDAYWNNPLAYPVQSLISAQEIDALKLPLVGMSTSSALVIDNRFGVEDAKPTATAENNPNITPLLDAVNLQLMQWTWASSTLLVDKPSKIAADADAVEQSQDTTVDGLLQLMGQAQKEVLIVSPYFVPGARMMAVFAGLRQRGVRVRVLTNSLASNDAPAAHVGYARYREALLKLGMEIFEMRAESPQAQRKTTPRFLGSGGAGSVSSRASLHAKVVVIDNRLLVVGSMNLDLRSQLQNSEVAIAIRSAALSREAAGLIEPAMANAAWQVMLLPNGRLLWRAPQGSNLPDSLTEPDASVGLKALLLLIAPFAPDEML